MDKANPALGHYACSGDGKTVVYGNAIYTTDGKATECGQQAPITKGTTVNKLPNNDDVMDWVRKALLMN